MVIWDNTIEEEESDATKKGQANRNQEWKMDWTGGRTKEELFKAVIDGITRKLTILVGYSTVRNTRLSKEEDVVVCLLGARI